MKPPAFEYLDPSSVDPALQMLAEWRDDARVLAGGQSLVPLLNFRLVRPRALIDVNGVRELAYVRDENGALAIGALTRHRTLEESLLVRTRCPLLAAAVRFIGHPAIRNRGTVGGSLAHADPAAEIPVVLTALAGAVVARSRRGERVVPAAELFLSYLTTALAPDELLVEVRLPFAPPRTGTAFLEVSRRHGDFALVAAAGVVTLGADAACVAASLALGGVGPVPVSGAPDIDLLLGERPEPRAVEEVAARITARLEPDSDLHAPAEYRRHVAGVLVKRVLREAAARARGE